MPRWVVIIIVGSLSVCVTCGSLGFLFWRKAQSSVSNEIASVIATQVADNIGTRTLATGEIVLTEDDLDVNTFITLDGSCGFNVTNGNPLWLRGGEVFGRSRGFGQPGAAHRNRNFERSDGLRLFERQTQKGCG